MKAGSFLSICLSIIYMCSGYKLLVVFPYPSKSHWILGNAYVKHLLNAGHEVTYITPYSMKTKHDNLRIIDVSSNAIQINKMADEFSIEKVLTNEIDMSDKRIILNIFLNASKNTITHENVQKLMQDPNEQFDAVIVEWLYSDLYAGFSAVFNCPYIWSSSMEPHALVLSLIDEDPNPAYAPDHMSSLEPPYDFLDRVRELWTLLHYKYIRWSLSGFEEEIYRNAFGPAVATRGRTLPSLEEVKYNASLMLGNSHVSSGRALRLPQNYKSIGGYHISDDIEPLTKELENIMDNAKNGVIYFSLGTVIQSKKLPEKIKIGLIKTFGGLRQTVIWKFEEALPDLPENVHIVQWAPQQSILAHPNCVLFISHGGLLSTTEALHYGVPIIGIPLFADQFVNVKNTQSKGFGKEVTLGYDTPKVLNVAIEEILSNPRYRERIKDMSWVYHDRIASPGAELVHWVEHVVRTRGAAHLRSPALRVRWYQKLYLDLMAVLILIVFIIVRTMIYFMSEFTRKQDLNKKIQ